MLSNRILPCSRPRRTKCDRRATRIRLNFTISSGNITSHPKSFRRLARRKPLRSQPNLHVPPPAASRVQGLRRSRCTHHTLRSLLQLHAASRQSQETSTGRAGVSQRQTSPSRSVGRTAPAGRLINQNSDVKEHTVFEARCCLAVSVRHTKR